MAIYIKGMELPTNCLTCPFTEKDDRMGTICYFTNIVALNIGRQKDCPLVYIPEPHGRLLDEDKIILGLDIYESANYENIQMYTIIEALKGAIKLGVETVIEGSEQDGK